MNKKARQMREEEPIKPPAQQCEKCEQWVTPGLGHFCHKNNEELDNEKS